MSISYCSRDDVTGALDVAETARISAQVDRLIAAASRSVERLCGGRRFYPQAATRYVDWPSCEQSGSYRVWLDGTHELTSLTSLTSGGATITDYFLEPQASGPPYTRIEIDLSGSDSLTTDATWQRSIELVGVFGACADSVTAGTLAASLDDSSTSVAITDSSTIGVGTLLLLDTEYVQVTARRLRSTGQTLAADLARDKAGTTVTVADASGITPGEIITVDAERMLVTDATATTLIVERAWSGSTLAAHTTGATVYAPRALTVQRAQLGTTAAAHSSGATVRRHTPPPLVQQLTIAETLNSLAQEQSGYARTIGSGEAIRNASGAGLAALRKQVYAAHGCKGRTGAV